ncbi:hypothetical protein ACLI1A_02250 [Flavobacterium sp. RHBU_3]|uniref:hypothetical protein n=1 Tax=Flavobacterium sp. RHBU_3 TaxID=3391184 RepID=UPI0039849AA3
MNFFKKLFSVKSKPEKPLQDEERNSPPNLTLNHSNKEKVNLLYLSEQNNPYLTNLIQAHNSIDTLNYNLAVVWALSLMKKGNEMPSVFMLASFAEPIDALEIRPYINVALNDLSLKEIDGEDAILAVIRYYVMEIVIDNSLRKSLTELNDLCNQYDHGYGLNPFYLLYYAWYDLDYGDDNYYYDGATLDNIESLVKKEAKEWLEKH